MMTDNLQEMLAFGLHLAREAETVILPRYRSCKVRVKHDGTEVTDADLAAERTMRTLICSRFPDHGIVGEEQGWKRGRSPYEWILDPIDGTSWFAMGMPMFGTLVGLTFEGEPIAGVMHFPILRETIYAARGAGCWIAVDGASPARVHVDHVESIAEAVVSCSGPQGSEVQPESGRCRIRLKVLAARARKFKFTGDSVQHAGVCRGKIHAAIDTVMHPWDIAAVVPCVEEAGGIVTDLAGGTANILYNGTLLSSSSSSLHRAVLQSLDTVPAFTSPPPEPVDSVLPSFGGFLG